MKFFSRKKATRNLNQFKQKAQKIDEQATLEAITGGTQSACHNKGGRVQSIYNYSATSTGAFNVSAINTGAIAAF